MAGDPNRLESKPTLRNSILSRRNFLQVLAGAVPTAIAYIAGRGLDQPPPPNPSSQPIMRPDGLSPFDAGVDEKSEKKHYEITNNVVTFEPSIDASRIKSPGGLVEFQDSTDNGAIMTLVSGTPGTIPEVKEEPDGTYVVNFVFK